MYYNFHLVFNVYEARGLEYIGYKPGNVTHLDQATVHLSNQRIYIRCSLMLENLIMNIYYQVKIVNLILALQVKRWFVHWTYANLNKFKDKPVICT